MGKRTGRPNGRPKKDSVKPSLMKEAPPEAWKWDQPRTDCLNMTVKGHTNVDIARQLGRHRSTIIEWKKRPEFAERLREKMGDVVMATKYRRLRQTSKFADASAKLLDRSYKKLLAPPKGEPGSDERHLDVAVKQDALEVAKDMGFEFRAWRKEERQDFGDDVKKQQTSVVVGGVLQHEHKQSSFNISMRDFLEQKIDQGVVDVEALPATKDKGRLLTSAVVQALSDPAVIDLLQEEDREESK